MSIQLIEIKKINADSRSANVMPNERFEKLSAHIQRFGQIQPIILRKGGKDGYIVIDGHYRLKALTESGAKDVKALIYDVTNEEATLLLASLNTLTGEDSPVKRGALFKELINHFDINELTYLVPESTEDIDALLKLIELEEQDIKKKVEQLLKEEAEVLPELLSFLLSAEDAAFVKTTLSQFDSHQDKALIMACQKISGLSNEPQASRRA